MFMLNGVQIEDTFAEAFKMWGTRVIITAINRKWALTAATCMTGFATSVIACGAEAAIEKELSPEETPDGRPGVSVLVFATNKQKLEDQLLRRIGQTVLTCPTTAAFNGLEKGDTELKIGGAIRYFGDGYQFSKNFMGRRLWRVPVMEGEFLIEEKFKIKKSVGGGNFLILGETLKSALEAAEKAVEAIKEVEGAVTPFPGGVCRSGSKVGSKYKFLIASTNTAFCPTIRGLVENSLVPEGVNSIYEIVINGLTLEAVKEAMKAGIKAAVSVKGIEMITAANYGGKLGQYQIYLKDVLGLGGE